MFKKFNNLWLLVPLFFIFCPQSSATCWAYSGQKFGIEARLLASIAQVESGMDPNATGKNGNGSSDVGLMQINSIHLPKLKKMGISSTRLKREPCLSIIVGASILADMMQVYGYGWEAVGAYNAGTGKNRHNIRMKYARMVWQVYKNPEFIF